jgi:hypothetical protein
MKNRTPNRRFGNRSDDEYFLSFLFANRLLFQRTNNYQLFSSPCWSFWEVTPAVMSSANKLCLM